jgi:hypothetical protein
MMYYAYFTEPKDRGLEQDTTVDLIALEMPSEPATTTVSAANETNRAVLVKPNPASMNNNSVLVAFLHALLSLLLFNFGNNTNKNTIKDNKNRKKTKVGSIDENNDTAAPAAVEETHVSISQTRDDEFEVEEIPDIAT